MLPAMAVSRCSAIRASWPGSRALRASRASCACPRGPQHECGIIAIIARLTHQAREVSVLYIPEHFSETRPEVLRDLLARHPLGLLIAQTTAGLTAEHIPMQWTARADGAQVLRGHVARANALWRTLPAQAPVLAVFTGARQYISPNWYVSKQESGKVVPTWNYATVHVRGRIRFIEDADWLAGGGETLPAQQGGARAARRPLAG